MSMFPYSGEFINPSEHFTFATSWRELADRDQPCEDWDDGFPLGTWEAYAREVPPE